MESATENCLHLEGLRIISGSEFRCPVCEERLDLASVRRWVREAEEDRDRGYSMIEGEEFREIAWEEQQREVYRRRKVLYELLQDAPRSLVARPEMILVSHEERNGCYDCKIFYKEPRPDWGVENLTVEASLDSILELRSDPNPVIRLTAEKLEEFHTLRRQSLKNGGLPPERRVFYASEL